MARCQELPDDNRGRDTAVVFTSPAEFGRFLQAEDERYRLLATGMKFE